MNTAIAQTSIKAYRATVPQRCQVRAAVLRQIEITAEGGTCIADVVYATGLEKSSVSGRFNELKKAGRIVAVGKRPSLATQRTAEHYRVATEDETEEYLQALDQRQQLTTARQRDNVTEAARTLGRQAHKKKKEVNQPNNGWLFK